MARINDILNHLNGQIAASQMVATLAICTAARNEAVSKNLADSIGKLSSTLDPSNHDEFNRGFKESISRMQQIVSNSSFEDGTANIDISAKIDT